MFPHAGVLLREATEDGARVCVHQGLQYCDCDWIVLAPRPAGEVALVVGVHDRLPVLSLGYNKL